MKSLRKLARRFWGDEQGLELSEYAVMAALIIAAVVLIVGTLGNTIYGIFADLVTNLGGTP